MSGSESSNIFQSVLTDLNGVETKFMGQPYEYWKYINSPSELGMSSDGTLNAFVKDFSGLISYTELLTSGGGEASKTGKPLGNKFFLPTGGKCLDVNSCDGQGSGCELKQEDRYIYINNVPNGNIPFISSAMGVNFSEVEGLIPGTISNLNAINPFAIMQAFTSGSTPKCQAVTFQTIDGNNTPGSETHFVSIVDLQNAPTSDPCNFPDNLNPVTGQRCKETFSNITKYTPSFNLPDDNIIKIYYAIIGILGAYILYRLMNKK